MNRLQFTTHLRGELGRRFSVADEEGGIDGSLRLVLVRRGNEEVLVVSTVEGWIRGLQAPPSSEDRVLIKHLAICIRRFFGHPEYLPSREFVWPGTPQTRGHIRGALDPRRWRRLGAQFPEEGQ